MILIIDKSRAAARKYADTLYYVGVPTNAQTPIEALSCVGEEYHAVLILNPDAIPDIHDYVRKLRAYTCSVPIFAIHSDGKSYKYAYIFDDVLSVSYVAKIYEDIKLYCSSRTLTPPGKYKLAGIDASCELPSTTFLWDKIKFTRTENMILRVLIATYPRRVSAKELLNLAFKKSRTPEPSNIRAHVSIMNKKFRSMTGRNLITLAINGGGYQILTPEIKEERAKLLINSL